MELQHPKATILNPADWFTGDVYLTPIYQGTGPSFAGFNGFAVDVAPRTDVRVKGNLSGITTWSPPV